MGERSDEDDASGSTVGVVGPTGFTSGIRAFNDDECAAETKGHAV